MDNSLKESSVIRAMHLKQIIGFQAITTMYENTGDGEKFLAQHTSSNLTK